MVLTQTEHNGAWEGGHQARVPVGRQSTSGTLSKQEVRVNPRANAYLQDVVSPIGQIELGQAGMVTLRLKMLKIVKKKGLGPKLRAVQLVPATKP